MPYSVVPAIGNIYQCVRGILMALRTFTLFSLPSSVGVASQAILISGCVSCNQTWKYAPPLSYIGRCTVSCSFKGVAKCILVVATSGTTSTPFQLSSCFIIFATSATDMISISLVVGEFVL